ncbi:MAG: type II toxin-antitoxin system VapC family toxin [Xanthobacteraceae bacterium]|jgi:predicted nucleic acid-binding protein
MRYLLDTNVVSETRRLRPDPGVTAFLSAADATSLFISVLTLGEMHRGVIAKRRTDPLAADQLGLWVDGIETMFADRILPVDAAAARRWGELSAARSLPVVDTLIAATALVNGLVLVTRNMRDLEATGATLIDPWLTGRRG